MGASVAQRGKEGRKGTTRTILSMPIVHIYVEQMS